MLTPVLEKVLILQDRDARRRGLEAQLKAIPAEIGLVEQKIAGEKAAIETAFFHTRYIDLGECCLPVIVLKNIKARASNHSRGIEMGIERENPLMQGARSPF